MTKTTLSVKDNMWDSCVRLPQATGRKTLVDLVNEEIQKLLTGSNSGSRQQQQQDLRLNS